MKVTEYVPFPYFTRNCIEKSTLSMGTSPITPCYDAEQLETKTHMGVRPRGVRRIHQAQGEPKGSSVTWVSSRKWYLAFIYLWTDQAKDGLEHCCSSEPERLLLKQKGLWPARRGHPGCKTLQITKGPASRLTNVWHGHPAGPCPRRGDASGGVGSDSDGALQPEEEYANVIASTNHLEILCFVTGL